MLRFGTLEKITSDLPDGYSYMLIDSGLYIYTVYYSPNHLSWEEILQRMARLFGITGLIQVNGGGEQGEPVEVIVDHFNIPPDQP